MIGNDIIDLKLAAERDPLRPRFMDKVFTEGEQEIIFLNEKPVNQAWLLWAMKESAYKAHQRRFSLPRNFNPLAPQCKIFSLTPTSVLGEVQIGNDNYKAFGELNTNFILSNATALPENQKVEWENIWGSEDLKKRLLLKISASYGWDIKTIGIEKDKNFIPVITHRNRPVPIPFSLSHHGKFAAFSLALMNY